MAPVRVSNLEVILQRALHGPLPLVRVAGRGERRLQLLVGLIQQRVALGEEGGALGAQRLRHLRLDAGLLRRHGRVDQAALELLVRARGRAAAGRLRAHAADDVQQLQVVDVTVRVVEPAVALLAAVARVVFGHVVQEPDGVDRAVQNLGGVVGGGGSNCGSGTGQAASIARSGIGGVSHDASSGIGS
jgi:hypothetical protein